MTGPTILNLDDLGGAPVGGKAEGLAKLVGLGLRVPPAFVVTGATPGNLPGDLEARYRDLGGGAVAVRSSAVGEDSAEASFAGQYDTVLDVIGIEALRAAIDECLASLQNRRAAAYRDRGGPADSGSSMSVVVQAMVPAASAGVLFTADPVTGRRDRVIVDAVEGLGEALVSGHAAPDHYVLDRTGRTRESEIAGAQPILSEAIRRDLLRGALAAEAAEGRPLDLEWAIDRDGLVHWLQARPITHLPPDPNELDTPITDPTHVYTRCNVGEMFPGACTPLSYSFTARGIDVGMQMMHVQVGIQDAVLPQMRFLMMNSGHLFLNLSTMSETATHALGSSAEQLALSVCGRPVTEFTIQGGQPPGRLRRTANGIRYLRYLLGQPTARREMRRLVDELRFPESTTAAAAWLEIDRRFPRIYDAMHYHLISSAGSGVLTPTLLAVIAGGGEPAEADHARVAALLAGAEDVESADIIAGAERIADRIAAHPDGAECFTRAEPDAALDWIRSPAAGAAGAEFERYLRVHGHRAIKELELRQPEWREDPSPVIRSLQVSLRQRGSARAAPASRSDTAGTGRAVAVLARMARRAVRSREETKSGLVAITTRFKEAYRALARLLVAEGLLPDPDAVFFLTHDELGRLARDGETSLVPVALARREAFARQETYEFPDVFQGEPRRVDLDLEAAAGESDGVVRGSPVSRGRVTGVARVVRTLDEAAALQRGEILIAPITDVGWTPYFSLIAGLVTDIGSAVSHGAVVAREYGLPAVVNTRVATRVFSTGDRVVLDGESGVVRLAEPDPPPLH